MPATLPVGLSEAAAAPAYARRDGRRGAGAVAAGAVRTLPGGGWELSCRTRSSGICGWSSAATVWRSSPRRPTVPATGGRCARTRAGRPRPRPAPVARSGAEARATDLHFRDAGAGGGGGVADQRGRQLNCSRSCAREFRARATYSLDDSKPPRMTTRWKQLRAAWVSWKWRHARCPFEQPGLEVARFFGEQLVAEVVGEAPAAFAQRAHDLRTKGRNQRVVRLGLAFPPDHLTQDRCDHVQVTI